MADGENLGSAYYEVDARTAGVLKAESAIDKFDKKARRNFSSIDKSVSKTNRRFKDFGRNASAAIASVDGPLGGISSRISSLTTVATSGGVALTAVAVAVTAITFAMGKGLAVLDRYNVEFAKTEAILKATGSASGFTAEQLSEQARAVAYATLASKEGIQSAQAALLTFDRIQGRTFTQAIKLTQDLAQVFGGDATSQAKLLGRALQDPVKGISALTRVGVTFSEQQKEQIENLVETNRLFEAQGIIIKTLEAQVGGAGVAVAIGTIAGSTDTLSQAWDEFASTLASSSGAYDLTISFLDRLSRGLQNVTEQLSDNPLAPDESGLQGLERSLDIQFQILDLEAKREGLSGRARKSITLQIEALRAQKAVIDEALQAEVNRQQKELKAFEAAEQKRKEISKQIEEEIAANKLAEAQELQKKLDKLDEQARAKSAAAEQTAQEGAVGFALGIIGDTQSTQDKLQQQRDLLDDYYEMDLITAKQHADALKSIDDQVTENRMQQQSKMLSASSDFFGESAELVSAFSGETSTAYKALFAVSKGFAIANAALQLQTAIANATALPWPANIPAIAAAVAQGANLASNIASISYDGGRLYGGSTAPNSLYKVTEDGRPEMFSDGRDSFLMTGSRGGSVTSNGDLGASSEPQWNIIVNNNAPNSRATAEVDDQTKTVKIAISEVGRQFREHYGEAYQGLIAGTNTTGRAT